MPLTDKGSEILAAMKKQYGDEKGEQVFYASKNAGKITGVDEVDAPWGRLLEEEVERGYHGQFATKGEGKEKEKGEKEPEAKHDDKGESLEDLMRRFDHLRDQMHKLDKRLRPDDDCEV